MPSQVAVELRCIAHQEGTFNAGAFVNGKQVVDDAVQQGDFTEVVALYRGLQETYPGVSVHVRFMGAG